MTEALAEQGTPTQLPKGEASQEIQAAQQSTAHPGIPEDAGKLGPGGSGTNNMGQPIFEPVNPTTPDARGYGAPQGNPGSQGLFRPSTDIEKFLFGPTQRPNESVATGLSQAAPLPVPQAAYDILPALQQAALSPDAPPQILALLQLIQHHSGQ